MKPTSIDNPFAVPAKRRSIFPSLKALGIVIACLCVVLALQFGSKHWLAARLGSDWENQSAEVRIERLSALSKLGNLGLPRLVRSLHDPQRNVARHAYELLLDQQASWPTLPDLQADEKHEVLAEHLRELAGELPEDRRGWLASLLNATITDTVEHSSPAASRAYALATELLSQSQLGATTPQVVDSSSPVRVALKTDSLPVELESEAAKGSLDGPEPQVESAKGERAHSSADSTSREPPTARLQAVPSSQQIALRPVPDDPSMAETRGSPSAPPAAERITVPVQHLTVAPFETYSTRSVITWLRSVQPKLRDVARSELIRRGFDETELELAARMADPDIRIRMGLLSDLNRMAAVDPRPWLLWMAEDAERDVRIRAITTLATMPDQNIRKELRAKLPHESDPAVASLLRRVLSQP